jgi:apolipoprotein N-acyltransferase
VLKIHKSAWLLVLLSAALQILVFPLPNLYMLGWVAVAPLLIGLLRTRQPDTLQLQGGIKLRPATPWQAFLLAYVCGILWYACTCYWIYSTMRQYGGVSAPLGVLILILFSMYLALYHGVFGLLISLLARQSSGGVGSPRASSHPDHGISLGPAGHQPGGQRFSGANRHRHGGLRYLV